jgi:hypothetical protein
LKEAFFNHKTGEKKQETGLLTPRSARAKLINLELHNLLLVCFGLPVLSSLVEKSERYLKQGHFDIEGKPETLTRQFLFEPFTGSPK